MTEEKTLIAIRLEIWMRDALREMGVENDRTFSQEARRAIRQYVVRERGLLDDEREHSVKV